MTGPREYSELSRAYLNLRDEVEQLRKIIKDAVDAHDSGNLEMSSPDIGEPAICAPYPWHEEWLCNARAAVAKADGGQP